MPKLTTVALWAIIPTVFADWSGIPTYPPPHDLSSDNSLVNQAWKNLSSTLDQVLQQNATLNATSAIEGLQDVTFSMGLFSLHDDEATALQYHYTSPQISESEFGTKRVDADSIYRIASVSKLFTVFAGLLELTNEDWNTPLTDIFPTLANVTQPSGVQDSPRWDHITPWALATQLSGITASGALTDLLVTFVTLAVAQNATLDTLQSAVEALAIESGLPPLSLDFASSCAVSGCNSTVELIDSIKSDPSVFLPWTTPAYSNINFILLGQVLLNKTGRAYRDYQELYGDAILTPLNMSSTFTDAPATNDTDFSRSVVAGPLANNFEFASGVPTIPSGGLLSTLNDLNKLGVAILNHTLLPGNATRKWMKPVSHTASLTYAIGAPWEIVRYVSPTSGKVTDIFTKLGDSGSYSGMLALIPDYDVGFTYLNAYYVDPTQNTTTDRATVALGTINALVETIMPALEAQAAQEALDNFAGTYVSEDENINSTLIIGTQQPNITFGIGAGLIIEQWTSNSTDALLVFSDVPRLLPSIPADGREVTFHATTSPQWNTYMAAGQGPFAGFYGSNIGWFTFDGQRYGGNNVNTFVFELDGQGAAVAVTNAATGLKMAKTT